MAEPEVGMIYQGTVVKLVDFGAFVNFFGAKDGLVHISQMAQGRVNKAGDVAKEGEKVWVKLMGFDDRGKVRLSMKVVDQATGQEIPGAAAAEKSERGERPPPAGGQLGRLTPERQPLPRATNPQVRSASCGPDFLSDIGVGIQCKRQPLCGMLLPQSGGKSSWLPNHQQTVAFSRAHAI